AVIGIGGQFVVDDPLVEELPVEVAVSQHGQEALLHPAHCPPPLGGAAGQPVVDHVGKGHDPAGPAAAVVKHVAPHRAPGPVDVAGGEAVHENPLPGAQAAHAGHQLGVQAEGLDLAAPRGKDSDHTPHETSPLPGCCSSGSSGAMLRRCPPGGYNLVAPCRSPSPAVARPLPVYRRRRPAAPRRRPVPSPAPAPRGCTTRNAPTETAGARQLLSFRSPSRAKLSHEGARSAESGRNPGQGAGRQAVCPAKNRPLAAKNANVRPIASKPICILFEESSKLSPSPTSIPMALWHPVATLPPIAT